MPNARLTDSMLQGDEAASELQVLKRRKGCPTDQDNDEQAVSQSSLNKLVGAAEVYDLEVKNFD